MRSNIIVLGVIAVFFYICSAGYTLWHMAAYDGRIEWTGSLGLALTGVMATLIGFYLVLVYRGQGGDPLDRLTLAPDSGWRRFRDDRGVGPTVPALPPAFAGVRPG